MIEKAFIIALLVLSIHYTMQPGEIFGRLGTWFEKHLPYYLHDPVYSCNVCMTPYYGTISYIIIYNKLSGLILLLSSTLRSADVHNILFKSANKYLLYSSVKEWLIVVIVAMGFNVLFNKWTPNDE